MRTNRTCYNDYSILNEDKSDYNLNWTRVTNSSNHTLNNAFKYTSSSILKDNPYLGSYATYLGGGYVYYVPTNNSFESIVNDLTLLELNSWLNRQTRAVFIEYTLYNPNIDSFMYSVILFEVLPCGTLVNTALLSPIVLFSPSKQLAITGPLIGCLILTLYLMIQEVQVLRKISGVEYFKRFWTLLDWSLYILLWISLIFYINKLYLQNALLESFGNKDLRVDKNVGLFYQSNDLFQQIISLCSFLATLRMIKLLRFFKEFSFLMLIIKDSLKSLISFSVVFLIMWLSFVQLIYLWYYDKNKTISTIVKTMLTTFQMLLGKGDTMNSIAKINYTSAAILFSSYNFMLVLIMVNILITLVSDKFSKRRKEVSSLIEESFGEFIRRKLREKLAKKTVSKERFLSITSIFENAIDNLLKKIDELNRKDNKKMNEITDERF